MQQIITPPPNKTASDKINRHSRFVKMLKITLPLLAFVFGAFFIVRLALALVFTTQTNIGEFALYDGQLIMDNPKLSGQSKQGEPYKIQAHRAIQNIDDSTKWHLENITAQFNSENGNIFDLTTSNAIYEINLETLIFANPLRISISQNNNKQGFNNATLDFQTATIDMQNNLMQSSDSVAMQWQGGELTADSFSTIEGGKKYIFQHSVKTILHPQQLEESQ